MLRRDTLPLVVALVIMLGTALPAVALGTHETLDERPTTPLGDFLEDVGSWVDPWMANSASSFADDHAPLVAFALYEELLGIRPEPCYWDTYAAYWAVAADLRALGQAPTREQMEATTEQAIETVERADALAELNAAGCADWGTDADDEATVEDVEATRSPRQDIGTVSASTRVIEIEATAALEFTDERGNKLEEIAVTPGETVLFRVHNTAGFDHTFYIGSHSELSEPQGTTDIGIGTWHSGVRELEWTVPADVSELMFGCTVPGHHTLMHGAFVSTPAGTD